MEKQKYYLGLDMGTSSVGWAVTNSSYELIRKKGKDMWGVREFDPANTAAERRFHRADRRRRQRQVAWLGLLKEYFGKEIEKIDEFNERYACKYYPEKAVQAAEIFNGLHNIMKDETRESYINRACYKLEYYFYGYRNKQTGLPKDFPGGVYKLIAENEKEYTHYLKFLKENAAPAVEFFVNSGNVSLINSIWLLTSMHYYALSDEYLTIYSLYKDYNSDKCDAAKVINELERLISQREKLMLLAEEVRIPPNRSTYLRNMSVFRQYMLDLRDYFKKTLEIGKKPKLDVMDLSYAMSSKFEFLR